MDKKELRTKLISATNDFELEYKDTLNECSLDSKTIDTLYDLGADIRHLLDNVIDIISND